MQLLAIEHRWSDIEGWFWEGVAAAGFEWEVVPHSQHHRVYNHRKIDIYAVRRSRMTES